MALDLSLRQLRAYATVARCASFTAAARELHISQSALSRTVMDVEQKLGATLLNRGTRRLTLTDRGAEVLSVAERVLTTHRAEMRQLERYLDGSRSVVTIATLPSVAAVLLPPVISKFREQVPGVNVRIVDTLARSVQRHVASGRADLAISVPQRELHAVHQRPYVRDAFFAAVPTDHPLARRGDLRWVDLHDQPFISIGADSSIRPYTDAAFAHAGQHPSRFIEASSITTAGGLIAAGLGVTALPALVHTLMTFTEHSRHRLVDPVVDRHLGLIVPAGRRPSPSAQQLLNLLESWQGEEHTLPPGVEWADTNRPINVDH